METKQCKHCKIFKPVTNFSKHKGRRDGLHSWCKDCKNADSRERNRLDPSKGKERSKKWREGHKEQKRAYGRWYEKDHPVVKEARKEWYKSHAQRLTEYKRELRAKYPEKFKARNAVTLAIRHGKLPPARSLKCFYCQNQASEYHHHKGYDEKHWLNVQAVCQPCHRLVEK